MTQPSRRHLRRVAARILQGVDGARVTGLSVVLTAGPVVHDDGELLGAPPPDRLNNTASPGCSSRERWHPEHDRGLVGIGVALEHRGFGALGFDSRTWSRSPPATGQARGRVTVAVPGPRCPSNPVRDRAGLRGAPRNGRGRRRGREAV